MSLDPLPRNVHFTIEGIQLDPILHILYRSLATGSPTVFLPRNDPLGNSIFNVLAIGEDGYFPFLNALGVFKGVDYSCKFHLIVGGCFISTASILFDFPVFADNKGPASRTRVT